MVYCAVNVPVMTYKWMAWAFLMVFSHLGWLQGCEGDTTPGEGHCGGDCVFPCRVKAAPHQHCDWGWALLSAGPGPVCRCRTPGEEPWQQQQSSTGCWGISHAIPSSGRIVHFSLFIIVKICVPQMLAAFPNLSIKAISLDCTNWFKMFSPYCEHGLVTLSFYMSQQFLMINGLSNVIKRHFHKMLMAKLTRKSGPVPTWKHHNTPEPYIYCSAAPH